MLKLLAAYLVLTCLYSCSAGMVDMSKDDYLKWYKVNDDLTREKDYDQVKFKVTYKTPELIYLMENRGKPVNESEFAARKAELGSLLYFNMKVETNIRTDLFTEYGINDVNYPIDLMQDEFYLLQGKDTIPCVLFHFERNYGLSSSADMSLAFNAVKDPQEDITLVYNDELFKTGLNKFRFTASSLHTIPKLRLR